MAKNKKLIKYTDRDFSSIKEGLVEYTKRYYPDTFKDFSEASFGSLMLDTVSYIGDVLSFYLDYQVNESFLDTSIEYNNILRLGEQVGYKQPLKSNSFGIVTLYLLCPVTPTGDSPDRNYLPVLAKGSKFSSDDGLMFTLVEDVEFNNTDNEIITATADETTGNPTSFAVKAYGRVISGELKETSISVGTFKRFLTIPISDSNISEIVSVTDTEGHEYFEVEYLSQDTIYKSVVNKDADTRSRVTNVIVPVSVPRRFIVSTKTEGVSLKFGYGSDSTLKNENITHPSNVVLKMHGRNYETDLGFDPSKLLETDKFGIAPANTTLRVVYRANTDETTNVATKNLTTVVDPVFVFGSTAVNETKISFVKDGLEVTNEQPIAGDMGAPTVEELKQRVNDVFASQNRAVTASDYEAIVYRMPAKFGRVKRAKIIRDRDSFKRNLNLYVAGVDENEKLVECNHALKNNLRIWINKYRMLNDTIDILDAKIVNIGITFLAVVNYDQDRFQALNTAINTVKDMFARKMDIGQPIYISSIYNELNNLEEIVDVVDVKIVNDNKTGGLYSDLSINLREYISADGRILYAPEDTIYELKYPNLDIKGTIR